MVQPVDQPVIGVAIVTYNSAKIIANCLSSLLLSQGVRLRIVITDNASEDDTCDVVRAWANEHAETVSFAEKVSENLEGSDATLTLIRSPVNGGFAEATNRGLSLLMQDAEIELFWLLNPDCVVLPDTAENYARAGADGNFALMGGRTRFHDHPDRVQTDGGKVSRWTGVCQSVNWGREAASARMPVADELDFITGANCVASRRFLENVGLMEEDYFLYYEEVDWAFRRGDLELRVVPEAEVLHHGGTVIGTTSIGRRPSPFANYFNYRNRMRFVRRFLPLSAVGAYVFVLAKVIQLIPVGAFSEARAIIAGALELPPPADVRALLAPQSHDLAFSPRHRERMPR
ncbi:glycosyltransferase family 2 protein [Altererythrobacter sp. JGD-16]|uniref:Glycosyltransferase family 2 protein n=2 Tax=Altererythrobacter lutimaris TaxID=2743979 RepID=A0A850HE80_9SPHN|nr:glycosyltransferase family 2 protein [Altererythrobacter lutimaris]